MVKYTKYSLKVTMRRTEAKTQRYYCSNINDLYTQTLFTDIVIQNIQRHIWNHGTTKRLIQLTKQQCIYEMIRHENHILLGPMKHWDQFGPMKRLSKS